MVVGARVRPCPCDLLGAAGPCAFRPYPLPTLMDPRHGDDAAGALYAGAVFPATMAEKANLLIDGAWVQSSDGATFPTLNPATQEVLADVPAATAGDVDRAM